MIAAQDTASDQPNHPLAVRMGVIAGVSQNVVIGTTMGSFSVLLGSVQERLHVTATAASLGIPLLLIGSSILAPFVGVLVARVSLRLLLLAGAMLTVLGFLTLAFTHSYLLYLLAYGLMFGPALSLAGSIGPATLVMRWFNSRRGLALGIVNLPIVVAVVPRLLEYFLHGAGLGAPTIYLGIGVISAVLLLPLILLTVDHPPSQETVAPTAAERRTADGSLSVPQLLARPRFWALCLAAVASMASSVMLGSLMVQMGESWHFTGSQSTWLQTTMSLVGIAGSVLFGWVADKLGGGRSLALIGFDCALLWAVLLLAPPFPVVLAVVGLIGLHGAGAVPTLGRGLSDAFGQASYSRGFGLTTVIGLPFIATAVVGSAKVQEVTGSFDPAVIGIVGFFTLATFLGLYAASGPKGPAPAPKSAPA